MSDRLVPVPLDPYAANRRRQYAPAVAEAAARELFSLGYPNYAFAPGSFGKANWCRERAAEFARVFKKLTGMSPREWRKHLAVPTARP